MFYALMHIFYVATHHLLYVTSFLNVATFARVRNNCFHVDNMQELFKDIHIDSIMIFKTNKSF